ncbi:MAG: ThiF family adenylyltransferase [Betaproteobacteria bacterium]|nr:ThiF family adenylyltransferase [Betaproteobacteria bacterium]
MDKLPQPPLANVAERYSRQVRFPAIGAAGQARISASRVAVIGCGALGSAAVDLLARAGVGEIVIVDRDFVEISNLQRQVLFDEADAAAQIPKAVAAANAVGRINSQVKAQPLIADATSSNIEEILTGAQVVIDGTDNFETRYLINDACVKLGLPWVYGGVIGASGMAMAILPGETPCLRCIYPEGQAAGVLATCETAGVIGAIVSLVAAVQWAEAVKILIGDHQHLGRGLATFDLWTNDYLLATGFPRLADCPCCAQHRFDYLEARHTSQTTTLCGRNAVQVSPGHPLRLDLAELGRRLASAGAVSISPYLVRLGVDGHEITVFADGRAIVKGTADLGTARSLYARYVGV